MNWNYRVIHHDVNEDPEYHFFSIHEVFYDDYGQITSWTENSVGPYGEAMIELEDNHQLMARAFDKPRLSLKELEASIAVGE